jgi:hypothetical protein
MPEQSDGDAFLSAEPASGEPCSVAWPSPESQSDPRKSGVALRLPPQSTITSPRHFVGIANLQLVDLEAVGVPPAALCRAQVPANIPVTVNARTRYSSAYFRFLLCRA